MTAIAGTPIDPEGPGPDASVSPQLPENRLLRWLLGATGISSLGDGVAAVCLPLLTAQATSDPRIVAGVAAAQRLPWLLFALPSGALADRYDRRFLLQGADVVRLVVLAGFAVLVASDHAHLVAIFALAVTLGTFESLFAAASLAVVPMLVAPAGRGRANGRLFSIQMTGEQFLGPALGGALFSVAMAAPFVVDSVSFALSALMLGVAVPRVARHGPPEEARTSLSDEMRDGLRWFRGSRPLVVLTGLIATLAFCQAMAFAVLVLLALRDFHLSSAGYGVFLAVGAAGNIGGGMLATRLRTDPATTLALSAGVAAAAYAVVGSANGAVLAAGALCVEAVAVAIGNVTSVTLRQNLIPLHYMGRVGSVVRTCVYGAMPLGAMAGGFLAEAWSLRLPFFTAAAAQLAVLLLATPTLRNLRTAG